uniref:Uncharacterized protein n=1 Tax=Anguilla anguilla TaxID=7936 RepID=A0A0E9S4M5_ANGAN
MITKNEKICFSIIKKMHC